MGDAWIDGRPVALDLAIVEAAHMLAGSRLPLIAGLGTDIAGARAAVALADRLHGVVDHLNSDAVLRDVAVMRQAGACLTTPSEARLRGDTLLMVGPDLMDAWPEEGQRLFSGQRNIFWLCPRKGAVANAKMNAKIKAIGRDVRELPTLLAVLRAHLAGRPAGKVGKPVADLATALQGARFGVAMWSAAALDELTIEMLFGLISDLNASTRFTGLPLAAPDNALGVLQACGWMTGFPMRTGFGRGYPEHDAWQFGATRLVDDGEADCALWISAYRAAAPGWSGDVPLISLTAGPEQPRSRVHIQVGRPALDHDTVEHDALSGMIVARAATHASNLPSVADIVARIAAALPNPGPWPC